jgi:hypothetical protein
MTYAQRVEQLENAGCTTSDAQGITDVECWEGKHEGADADLCRLMHAAHK